MMSSPKSGKLNDIYNIESVMEDMFADLEKADISVDGLLIKDDTGLNCDVL